MTKKSRPPKDLPLAGMFSRHQVFRPFTPRTPAQHDLVRAIQENTIVVVRGAAGTGKTALCAQTALQMIFDDDNPIERLVIVRHVPKTFGEDSGALPGGEWDKMAPYSAPVLDNLRQMLNMEYIEAMIEDKTLEILPMSFVLGRTFANCAVIIEEAQNLDAQMVLLLATRVGKNSVLMFNGDPAQAVVRGRNGMNYAKALVEGIKDCAVIELPESDIQRHPVIKAILQRARQLEEVRVD